ncbi:MAG TPA: O-antigen ligase family protein [Acidimicrobiia bacterium]|nr:O-antigen ligase family protein [Acidimicrobiia bacterium]
MTQGDGIDGPSLSAARAERPPYAGPAVEFADGREHTPFLDLRGFDLVRAALVTSLILLIPINTRFLMFISQHSPHLAGEIVQYTSVGLTDIVFIALIVSVLPLVRRPRVLVAPFIVGLSMLVVASAVHVLVSPSDQGIAMTVRLAGAVAVAIVISTMSWQTLRVVVVWPIAVMGLVQGGMALSQTLTGTGRLRLDEIAAAGASWTAGRGTFGHEYGFAAFLMLSLTIALAYGFARGMRPTLWISVCVASAAIASTFGRAAALAVIMVGLVYVVGWWRTKDRMLGASALATLGALGVGLAITHSGWLARVSSGSSVRVSLASRSLDVIAINPVFGVGPGRYGAALADIGLVSVDRHIVHNVPLLVTAEFGVILGLAFAVWLLTVGVISLRSSFVALAVFVGILPLMFFDNLHYVIPGGVPMLGLWCGALAALIGTGWRQSEPAVLAKG